MMKRFLHSTLYYTQVDMEENRTVEQNSRDFVALGLVKIQFPSEGSKCENFFCLSMSLYLYMLSGTHRLKIT